MIYIQSTTKDLFKNMKRHMRTLLSSFMLKHSDPHTLALLYSDTLDGWCAALSTTYHVPTPTIHTIRRYFLTYRHTILPIHPTHTPTPIRWDITPPTI